jgi:hypothetical protein
MTWWDHRIGFIKALPGDSWGGVVEVREVAVGTPTIVLTEIRLSDCADDIAASNREPAGGYVTGNCTEECQDLGECCYAAIRLNLDELKQLRNILDKAINRYSE